MEDSPPSKNLTTVMSDTDAGKIGIARSVLESSGMEVFVFDRQIYGTAWPMRLVVHSEDADDAIAALKRYGFIE